MRRDGGGTGLAFEKNLRAQDGLDTLSPRLFVELDRAKEIVEIGDSQSGLAVFGSGFGHLVDAIGTVNDGELGVQAQMNKHAGIVETPAAHGSTGARCALARQAPPVQCFSCLKWWWQLACRVCSVHSPTAKTLSPFWRTSFFLC